MIAGDAGSWNNLVHLQFHTTKQEIEEDRTSSTCPIEIECLCSSQDREQFLAAAFPKLRTIRWMGLENGTEIFSSCNFLAQELQTSKYPFKIEFDILFKLQLKYLI